MGLMDSVQMHSVRPRLSAFASRFIRGIICLLPVGLVPSVMIKIAPEFSSFWDDAFGIFLVVWLMLLLLVPVILVLNVTALRYTIDKGRVAIDQGPFYRYHRNYELYRVEDIRLEQTVANRLTGDGTLFLDLATGHGGRQLIALGGLAPIEKLQAIFENLRNLVLLLRTAALGKGVIY